MRNICIFVFSFILGYTDSQVVDIDELYSLLQDRYQARSETGQPKTASPNPDEKIDVEGLTQRLDVLENEISFIRKAQQLEADRTEPDSIQSQVMILRRAFKAEKTVARKLKLQMISLNQQVEISLENLIMQIKEIMAKQSTHEEIIEANKASVDLSHENLEIQINALTEKQTTQEKIIKANKASVAQLSNPPKVHFYADVDTNLKLSAGSKVVFNDVLSESGGGYNNADGVFTVPVTGVYLISVVLANQNPTTTWLVGQLTVDSKSKAGVISRNIHDHQRDQSSNIAILKLSEGQKVWVEIYSNKNVVVQSHFSTLAAVLLHT